ncbi:MAG: helix-turn-helix domain-containing protein [Acidobacteriota bacterium]
MSKRRPRDLGILEPGLFRALCEPSRLSLLGFLGRARRPLSVTEIAASGCCPRDLSVVSRHLAQLARAGVLASERIGKEVRYRLATESLVATLRGLADAIESCCPVSRKGRKKP